MICFDLDLGGVPPHYVVFKRKKLKVLDHMVGNSQKAQDVPGQGSSARLHLRIPQRVVPTHSNLASGVLWSSQSVGHFLKSFPGDSDMHLGLKATGLLFLSFF